MQFSIASDSEIPAKLSSHRSLRFLRPIERLLARFSPGDRLILYGLTIVFAASTLALLASANAAVSTRVPTAGGSITEGDVGPVRFVNPVLTMSQADEDVTELVYSGLTRVTPDGQIVPDLAESYEISQDGTTYTFKLRADATFQDGTPVTSTDVAYTIAEIQDPAIKSPHRADWEGVTVSTPDSHTVIFTLPHAYAPFIQNTTLGILPSHLWKNVSAEEFPFNPLNTHPVGSGAYKINSIDTDSTGAITAIDLVPFSNFELGTAYLSHITIKLYPNEDELVKAFNAGAINAIAGVSSDDLAKITRSHATLTTVLPRVFGVFFNQSHAPVLADASVRKALDQALDKDRLVQMVLGGYGYPLSGPIPPGIIDAEPANGTTPSNTTVSTAYTDETINAAKATLQAAGWSFDQTSGTWKKGKQELSFTLATADIPELTASANAVATAWRQAGIKVTLQVYPLSELNTNVIRPRAYDAVLFGEVVGRDLDLFAFWHSSQRNDPGLNLSLYTNANADTLLSQARATTDPKEREKLYMQFESLVQKDRPAIFLYAPEFLYVVPKSVQGIELGALTTPSERFVNAYQWYTDTENVWNIFVR